MISLRKLLPLLALIFCLGIIYLPGCDTLITEVNEFTIAGHPTAEFTIDSLSVDSGCTPLIIGFVDRSSGPHQSWLWKFGDGDSSLDTNPVHTYNSAGTYTVSLTITDSTVDEEPGGDIEVKNRFIIVGTTIDSFSADTVTGCPGMEVSFTPINYGGIASYSWNFGDGSSPVLDSNPTHTYDSIGVFSCTLSVIGGCGSKVIGYDSLITIKPCPIARIGADTLYGCQPLEVNFADTTDYWGGERDSLFWWIYTNDTFVDSARSDSTLQYEFTTPGKYVVWADVFSEGGTAMDTLDDTIFVWGSAFATFTANGAIALVEGCLDSLWLFYVDFEAVIPDTVLIESFDSLVWDFGDGKRSNPNDSMPLQVSHPYDSAGEYTIRLFSYGQCNADTAIEYPVIKMVCVSWPFDTVLAGFTVTPDADTAADIQGYPSDVFTFTDTTPGGMLGRTWDFGDDLSDTGMITAHQYADTGTYTVTLTVGNCCTSAEVTETVVIDTMGAFGAFRRYKDETVKR